MMKKIHFFFRVLLFISLSLSLSFSLSKDPKHNISCGILSEHISYVTTMSVFFPVVFSVQTHTHTHIRRLGMNISPDTLTVCQFSVLEFRCVCVCEFKSIWCVFLSRSLFLSRPLSLRCALNFYVVCELSLEPAICKFCISLLSIFFLLRLSFS